MKLTESKLRNIIREELQEQRTITTGQLESAIDGMRVANVTDRGDAVSIVFSDGRTSKALTIEGGSFKIERI